MSQRIKTEKFPHDKSLILGIVLSILGLGCIVDAIVGFTLHVWGHYVGTGLWCGTVIFAAGVSGIISSQFRGSKSVKCYFLCSSIAAGMSLVMIIMSSAGLDYSSNFYKNAAYFKTANKKSTFYCYVAALTLSLLSLIGNISSLFICAQHSSFYKTKSTSNNRRNSSSHRSTQGNYVRASTNSRSVLEEPEVSNGAPRYSDTSSAGRRKEKTTDKKVSENDGNPRQHMKRSYSDHHHHRNKDRSNRPEQLHGSLHKHKDSASNRGHCHGYRSLPHRSQCHRKSRPSYDAEAGRELLPTAFNEDELPSYTDALKHPPLSHHQFKNRADVRGIEIRSDVINGQRLSDPPSDDYKLSYRSTDQLVNPEGQAASLNISHELHQNQRNEEAEMHRTTLTSPNRLSLKQYINPSTPKEVPSLMSGNTSKFVEENIPESSVACALVPINTADDTLYKLEPHTIDTDEQNNISLACPIGPDQQHDSKPAFKSLNSDANTCTTIPITIGSPRSAFRPVRQRNSQKLINESQPVERDTHINQPDRVSDTGNGNVWRNIVLPTLLKTETSEPVQCPEEGASNKTNVQAFIGLSNINNEDSANAANTVNINVQRNETADSSMNRALQGTPLTLNPSHRTICRSGYSTLPLRELDDHNPLHLHQLPSISHQSSNQQSVNPPMPVEASSPPIHRPANLDQSRDCDTPYYSQIL